MITKFKIFENVHSNLDPWGEEDWDNKEITVGCKVKVLDDVLRRYIYGPKVANVPKLSERVLKLSGNVYRVTDVMPSIGERIFNWIMIDEFVIPDDCVEKVDDDIFENNIPSPLDPFGEEDWDNKITLKKGDIVKILPKIADYIDKGWDDNYFDYINKYSSVIEPYLTENEIDCCIISSGFNRYRDFSVTGYLIPLDCVEKID